jgi:prepilin peptidase dependent protein B
MNARRGQRGLSIVEMMVGVAIGLIIVAAATLMVAAQLADNRRLLLETQIQQDLRATADLISRDLRRAGFWKGADRGTATGAAALGALANPYVAMSPPNDGDTATEVTYRYASPANVEDNAVTDDERLGFRLNRAAGSIESQLGADNWQALTDTGALKVTRFLVTADHQPVPLACHRACSPGGPVCPPVQLVRAYRVEIEGEARADAAIRRSVRTYVRVRNDEIIGVCRD